MKSSIATGLLALVLTLGVGSRSAAAQTVAGTASWAPNPATDNVVQYTLVLNALPPVVVLPAACTATVCTQALPAIPLGASTLTLTAQNRAITGGALQSSGPKVLSFTVQTVPVTVLGVTVTVP